MKTSSVVCCGLLLSSVLLAATTAAAKPVSAPANTPFVTLDTQPDTPQGVFVRVIDTGGRRFVYPETYAVQGWRTGAEARRNEPTVTSAFTLDSAPPPFGCSISPSGRYVVLDMAQGGLGDFTSYTFYLWDAVARRLMLGSGENLFNQEILWSPDARSFLYVRGGSPEGQEEEQEGPATLKFDPIRLTSWSVLPLPNKPRAYTLAENPLAPSAAWINSRAVLYSVKPKVSSEADNDSDQRPSIYEIVPGAKAGTRVIERAYDPVPSPDGRWVACLGWPEAGTPAEDESTTGRYLSLYLIDRRTKKRLRLHEVNPADETDSLVWSADGRTLYDVWSRYVNTRPAYGTRYQNDYPGHAKARVLAIDVPSLELRGGATLIAEDAETRTDPKGQFVAKGLSRTGNWLYVLVNETGRRSGKDPFVSRDQYRSLVGIRLDDWTTRVLWKTKNVYVSDWHELTGPSDPWAHSLGKNR